jgi:hypothetical protein
MCQQKRVHNTLTSSAMRCPGFRPRGHARGSPHRRGIMYCVLWRRAVARSGRLIHQNLRASTVPSPLIQTTQLSKEPPACRNPGCTGKRRRSVPRAPAHAAARRRGDDARPRRARWRRWRANMARLSRRATDWCASRRTSTTPRKISPAFFGHWSGFCGRARTGSGWQMRLTLAWLARYSNPGASASSARPAAHALRPSRACASAIERMDRA